MRKNEKSLGYRYDDRIRMKLIYISIYNTYIYIYMYIPNKKICQQSM